MIGPELLTTNEQPPIIEGQQPSIGVVAVIVSMDSLVEGVIPEIRTVIERQTKATTDRNAGQLSLPAETRKKGENEVDNLMGALAEFSDSDDVVKGLKVAPDFFYSRGSILVKGMPADVTFFVYDGPKDKDIQPVDPVETQADGWRGVDRIGLMNGQARPLVHDAIDFALQNGVFDRLREQRDRLVSLGNVLPEDFSIKDFIKARDLLEDIDLPGGEKDPEVEQIKSLIRDVEQSFNIGQRVFGERVGACSDFTKVVDRKAKELGLDSVRYQAFAIHGFFGGTEAGVEGFAHEFNVVGDGKRRFIVDLTGVQFADPQTGKVRHKLDGQISGDVSEHPILEKLARDGFVELTEDTFRDYLRFTAGASDKSYIDNATYDAVLANPLIRYAGIAPMM